MNNDHNHNIAGRDYQDHTLSTAICELRISFLTAEHADKYSMVAFTHVEPFQYTRSIQWYLSSYLNTTYINKGQR